MIISRSDRDRWIVSWLWFFICLSALLGDGSPCHAQETGKIHFLTFRLTNGVFVLAKSMVVTGTLKPQPDESHKSGLEIVLEKGQGETIWSRHVDDPGTHRFEYEDPDHPGVIKATVVTVTNAEFVVRAPFHKEARQVAIFRIKHDSVSSASGTKTPATQRTLLMRVPLPAEESR